MKRKLILILISLTALPGMILAQQDMAPSLQKSLNTNLSVARQPSVSNTTNALFDLKFDYVLPRGGFAGITWTYSNFWVSKWQSDSVFTVDTATGVLTSNFAITHVSGIRGMAFDGTGVWVSNNTTSIFKVDTLTKAVIDTILAPIAVRGIAYDSSANGGAGGFWIANYSTDIIQIDMSGVAITSIPASTHGLTGMYSIAFDPWSSGGPFIWAFDYGATGTQQNLVRISAATGIKDLVHDVGLEIGGSGIAGGLSITGFANPGPHTIIGVSQDSPDRIFGLELADYVPPAFEASADTLNFYPALTRIPSFLVNPINWELLTTNNGTSQLDTIFSELTVNDGSSNVFTSNAYAAAVPSITSTVISFPGTYTPAAAPGITYRATAVINTGNQVDAENGNDTASYSFSVTDTTMGRNGAVAGRIGIGNGTGGTIGLMFDVPVTVYATSITFSLGRGPTIGDSIKAELYDWGGSTPGNLLATSANYVFTPSDTDGAVITLPLVNGPIQLTAGSYIAGIQENNFNVSINYSFFNWRPNTTWIYIASSGWRPSEAINFRIVPFVFLNVWSQQMISVDEVGNTVFSVYPNPGSDQFIVDFPEEGNYNIAITDIQGKIVYRNKLNGSNREAIFTSDWSNGMYITKVESNGKSYYARMIVNH